MALNKGDIKNPFNAFKLVTMINKGNVDILLTQKKLIGLTAMVTNWLIQSL